MNYWKECISIAADECGLQVTKEQLEYLAEAVEGGHENYGMAHGYDAIQNPLEPENKHLRDELKAERNKVICKECNGRGLIVSHGPYHSAESTCWKCRGDGRHA
jgi:hypothetical protein